MITSRSPKTRAGRVTSGRSCPRGTCRSASRYRPSCRSVPAGYPLIMAAARVTAGRSAMFAVTPLMGGLAVYLMFLLGRHLAGPAAGLLAAALSAASPTFLIQLFQPMNDVTAAAVWAAALVAAISAGARGTPLAAAGAGLLTAAALVVRPNLAPLAAMTAAGVVVLARDRTIRPGSSAPRHSPLPPPSGRSSCCRCRMPCTAHRSGRATAISTRCSRRRTSCPISSAMCSGPSGATPSLIVIALAAPFALKRYGSNRDGVVAARLCGRDACLLSALRRVRRLVVHALPASGPSAVAGTHRRGARSRASRNSPRPRGSRLSSSRQRPPSRCSFTPVRPATSSASAISNGGSGPSASSSRRCLPTPRSSRCTTAAASGSTRRDPLSDGRTSTRGVSTMRSHSCGGTAAGHTCSSNGGRSRSSASASPASVSARWTGPPRPKSTASGSTTRTTTTGSGGVRP